MINVKLGYVINVKIALPTLVGRDIRKCFGLMELVFVLI